MSKLVMYGVRLTEKEAAFVNGIRNGLLPAMSAANAGYSSPLETSRALLTRPNVGKAVREIQTEAQDEAAFSRAEVCAMVRESYTMARDAENPGAMVRAAAEAAKLSGLYITDENYKVKSIAETIQEAMRPGLMGDISDAKIIDMAGLEQ